MPVYKQKNHTLEPIKEEKIRLEKDIQELTEKNLEAIFGLKFVSTEFALNNLRIDTLAFDPETNSFVIIEYKRDKSFSIIDQGYAYLALMLNNKADFILEFNERMQQTLKRDDIDWSQSRVIFIAHSFTPHQKQAIDFKDLPLELWEVKKYEDDLVFFNPIKATQTAESIKTVSKDETVTRVTREVKSYNIESHTKKGSEEIQKLFEQLKEQVLELDERVEEKVMKPYIAYKIDNKNIICIEFRKNKIRATFTRTQPSDLKDPENKAYLRKKSMEYFNQHLTDMELRTPEDANYFIMLAKQVLERFEKNGVI